MDLCIWAIESCSEKNNNNKHVPPGIQDRVLLAVWAIPQAHHRSYEHEHDRVYRAVSAILLFGGNRSAAPGNLWHLLMSTLTGLILSTITSFQNQQTMILSKNIQLIARHTFPIPTDLFLALAASLQRSDTHGTFRGNHLSNTTLITHVFSKKVNHTANSISRIRQVML